MQHGHDRSDVPHRWPSTLHAPSRPPKLVYLDLLHWIGLSKAYTGHPDGEKHRAVLEALINARDSGNALFPISDSTIAEISLIQKRRHREDLCGAIEILSRFFVVTSRSMISIHEIENMFDELAGPRSTPIPSVDYLDWGITRAFGIDSNLRVFDESGADVTEGVRVARLSGPDAFDEMIHRAEIDLARGIIIGPPPEEETYMRSLGWLPAHEYDNSGIRARQEHDLQEKFRFDRRWQRGRIRDVVSANEISVELMSHLDDAANSRSVTMSDLFPTTHHARVAFDSMPSFDVAVTLKTEYHRDSNHRWTSNDIHDIDALGSTLPYCDVVVTDKAAASQIRRSGLDIRLNTIVLASIADLPAIL